MTSEQEIHREGGPWYCLPCGEGKQFESFGVLKAHFEDKHPDQMHLLEEFNKRFGLS